MGLRMIAVALALLVCLPVHASAQTADTPVALTQPPRPYARAFGLETAAVLGAVAASTAIATGVALYVRAEQCPSEGCYEDWEVPVLLAGVGTSLSVTPILSATVLQVVGSRVAPGGKTAAAVTASFVSMLPSVVPALAAGVVLLDEEHSAGDLVLGSGLAIMGAAGYALLTAAMYESGRESRVAQGSSALQWNLTVDGGSAALRVGRAF